MLVRQSLDSATAARLFLGLFAGGSAEEGAEAPQASQRWASSGPSALTLPLLGSKANFTSQQEVLQEMAKAVQRL